MITAGLVKRQALRNSAQQRPSHVLIPPNANAPMAAEMPSRTPDAVVPTAVGYSQAELDQRCATARAEGVAVGRQQAMQELLAAGRDQVSALQELIQSIAAGWKAERARMVDALSDFAFVATTRMLGDSLSQPEMARAAVEAALQTCGSWQCVTVELHPRDAQLMAQHLAAEALPGGRVVRVVPSEEVRVGGCRIRSTEGELDARLEFQLAQLRMRLDKLHSEEGLRP